MCLTETTCNYYLTQLSLHGDEVRSYSALQMKLPTAFCELCWQIWWDLAAASAWLRLGYLVLWMFGLARTRRPQLPPLSFTRLQTQYALNSWRMEDLRGVFEREMVRPGSAVDGYTGTNRFSQKIGWQFHMQSTVISSRKSPAIALYDKVSPRTSKVRHRQWTVHYEAVISFHIKEGPVRASVTPAPAYPTNDLSFSVQIPRNCVPIVSIIHKHTRISRNVNSILCQCHDYCMRNFFVMT